MRSSHVLEIRVHGVSNTPPQSVLLAKSEQDVTRVAGDEVTGFYQRNDQDPLALVQTQAYSWGQLTAGVRAKKDLYRALWMLLLPFALVNVAFWSRPRFPDQTEKARTGGLTSYLARLLAASLTVTLILAATGVGVDLIGWQWQRAAQSSVKTISWLGFLRDANHGWSSEGARPLAIGTPFARRCLGSHLRSRAEVIRVRGRGPDRRLAASGGRDMPHGEPRLLARRPAGPPARGRPRHDCRRSSMRCHGGSRRAARPSKLRRSAMAGFLLLAVLAMLLLLSLVLLALPAVTDRYDDHQSRPRGSGLGKWLPPAALVAFVLSAGYLLLHRGLKSAATELPGFDATVRALFLCQVLVLVALAMSARWSKIWSWVGVLTIAVAAVGGTLVVTIGPDRLSRHFVVFGCVAGALLILAAISLLTPSAPPEGTAPRAYGVSGKHAHRLNRPAWRGAGATLLGGMGLLLGALYAAGILFFVSDWLTIAPRTKGEAAAVRPPAALGWAAAGLVPFVVIFVGYIFIVFVNLSRRSAALVDNVPGADASRTPEPGHAPLPRPEHSTISCLTYCCTGLAGWPLSRSSA